MDWPVVGSIAGVTALGTSLAVGGWLVIGSTEMQSKKPTSPVLLVDAQPQQTALYSALSQPPATPAPILISIPPTERASLPYTEGEKPSRVLRLADHPVLNAPAKKSLVAKPLAEKSPEHPQHKPPLAIVDERYAHVLTAEKVVQLRRMLHLRADQAQNWPPVEAMLHQIGRIQMAHIRRGEKPEVDSGVMMQLYSAAQPLLASLAPEQKEKIRSLARSLGYPNVASLL
jgi:hypothetical protein